MGIKNIKGDSREFEKPLTIESMGKFIEFLKSHGFEPKEGNLEPNPEKPQRAYTLSMAKEPCLVTMLTMITLAHQLDLPLTIELDRHTTSNYLEGNLPRLTTRLWNNSENRQSKTKNKNI
jgi:hypothetical protein